MTKVRKKIGTIPINDIEQQVQQSTSAAITQMQQDVSDFIDEETATLFRKVASDNGVSAKEVLVDFMKDYIVSGGHPEQVVNKWPWNKKPD